MSNRYCKKCHKRLTTENKKFKYCSACSPIAAKQNQKNATATWRGKNPTYFAQVYKDRVALKETALANLSDEEKIQILFESLQPTIFRAVTVVLNSKVPDGPPSLKLKAAVNFVLEKLEEETQFTKANLISLLLWDKFRELYSKEAKNVIQTEVENKKVNKHATKR